MLQWPLCYCAWWASKHIWLEAHSESTNLVKSKLRHQIQHCRWPEGHNQSNLGYLSSPTGWSHPCYKLHWCSHSCRRRPNLKYPFGFIDFMQYSHFLKHWILCFHHMQVKIIKNRLGLKRNRGWNISPCLMSWYNKGFTFWNDWEKILFHDIHFLDIPVMLTISKPIQLYLKSTLHQP